MKRLLFLALAFLLYAASPLTSWGQSTLRDLIEEDDSFSEDSVPPQRIGVPQSQFNLSSNGHESVGGYCFDEYLIAPRRVTRFENVLAGNDDAVVRTSTGETLTLRDAIARGVVDVKAHQLTVKFINLSDNDLTVDIRRPVVLWDRPAGDVNPLALAAIDRTNGNADYDQRQKNVWRVTSAERHFAVLGYSDRSIWDYDQKEAARELAKFQKEYDLSPTGELDAATLDKIASADVAMRNRLREMGFPDREKKSIREDLAAQIRAYQRYVGVPADGRWSSGLTTSLATNESVFRQLRGLKTSGKPADEVLADPAAYPNVLTYLNNGSSTLVLVETSQGVELWSRRPNGLQYQGRGERAVRDLDEAAAAMANRATKSDRVVIYPRVADNGAVTIGIDGNLMQLNASEVDAYVQGGEMPKALADLVGRYTTNGNNETGRRGGAQVIVYRGPFFQGRAAGVLQKLGLDQIDGAKLAGAFDKSFGEKLNLFISNDLRTGATNFREGSDTQGSLDPMRTRSQMFAEAK